MYMHHINIYIHIIYIHIYIYMYIYTWNVGCGRMHIRLMITSGFWYIVPCMSSWLARSACPCDDARCRGPSWFEIFEYYMAFFECLNSITRVYWLWYFQIFQYNSVPCMSNRFAKSACPWLEARCRGLSCADGSLGSTSTLYLRHMQRREGLNIQMSECV
jgi:hypothetical protein